MRATFNGIAVGLALITGVGYSAHVAKPPEASVCRPLAHTIEHWWPVLLKAKPTNGSYDRELHPWLDASNAIAAYVSPRNKWLPQWEVEASDAIAHIGYGLRDQASLRQALAHISYLCPSLPRSYSTGKMPG